MQTIKIDKSDLICIMAVIIISKTYGDCMDNADMLPNSGDGKAHVLDALADDAVKEAMKIYDAVNGPGAGRR